MCQQYNIAARLLMPSPFKEGCWIAYRETQNTRGERGGEMAIPRGRRKLGSTITLAEFPLCLSVGFAELVRWSCDFTSCLCVTLSRVCEYVGTLEHTHFRDGTSQPPLTISQPQKAPGGSGLLGDLECEGSPPEQSPEQESSLRAAPVIQPLSIQELIREGSRGRASDFRGGSLMTGSSAAKAVLTLSTQADRCVRPPPHPPESRSPQSTLRLLATSYPFLLVSESLPGQPDLFSHLSFLIFFKHSSVSCHAPQLEWPVV